jgi:hypothetical protein
MHKKIYLCGPIMDDDPDAAKDWRTRAKLKSPTLDQNRTSGSGV